MTYVGKKSKKEWIYVYVSLNHYALLLTLNIVNQPQSNKILKKSEP